ncbi:MAG: sulfite oxidase [Gammaproteobacteria bacterium]|jgi:DMSO/TMAO reductase YedYZ molybdopterin-dependent catalytic subunit|nr:sulfite oxidase [Gammaproteobacteria bacterium]MBT6043811.1 sulfite oxidase [Gammaproteobacteria bacterium]
MSEENSKESSYQGQEQEFKENPRRKALKTGVAMGGLAATASMPFWSTLALGASEELVQFTDMPEGYTVPPVAPGGIHYLDTSKIDSFYTPNDDFYIIQHYNQPQVAESAYRLNVTGLVNKPLEFTLADLKRHQKFEIDAGFECGGNSPRLFQGLIGNARWGGVRLVDLLEEAGLQRDGVEVVFYGADKGMEKTRNDLDMEVEMAFGRSIHIDDALNPDIILAYEMNGEALPLFHGAPLRLVMPGWYGVANVKWLSQIHIQDSRYMGRFMGRDYVTLSKRNIGGEERWEERSVTRIQLKSSIIRVTKNGNDHNITGFVLNDGTPLRSVEVKIDNGPWQQAEIDPASKKYSWKLFNFNWQNASSGEHTIVSRVTDVTGQVQATQEQMPEKPTRWENYAQFPRTVMIG